MITLKFHEQELELIQRALRLYKTALNLPLELASRPTTEVLSLNSISDYIVKTKSEHNRKERMKNVSHD